jgi:transcriptional regulator with PAS, ATPase and Fis domain
MTGAEKIRAIPGGKFGEEDIGCNAAGTVFYTDTPLQMSWQEHYSRNWQDWIAQGAPIHDPSTNDILGVIFTAGYREFSHPSALGLVIRAAAMVEVGVREQQTQARLSVLERFAHLTTHYPTDGLLAIDKRGCILAVNPTAEKILSLPHSSLIGRRLQNLPILREWLGPPVTAGPMEPVVMQAHSSRAVIFPVSAGRATGAVVLLPRPSPPSPKGHLRRPWVATYTFANLIGHSLQFRACVDLAYKASQQDWPLLLSGESGTGKELFAQAIHSAGPRRHGPFVAFNCASISDELIGTELFGYSEGTFTGALRGGKAGKIQLAHTGTLFLDDIDSMPQRMQLSLLRVLEDNQVVPLGAPRPQAVDVRVIAASNSDLEQAVREGRFRHDLYYRLNVFPIVLPSLRERAEDISLLAEDILSRHAPSVTISEEALQLLTIYSWPGNVRELRNVLIAASARAQHGRITPADLPTAITRLTTAAPKVCTPHCSPLKETERDLLVRTLQQTASVSQAASLLGLHFTTLYRKLRKYGIEPSLERKKTSHSC